MTAEKGAPAGLARIPEIVLAAAPPFALSLLLSAFTVGTHPQWQDSSLYLSAVRELGVLYPPGFVLYLLLCKAWTLVLGPVFGFTLSVHLFSAACAAGAAAAVAGAALAVTRHAASSAAAGCLAASGYTWWFSGLYAKGYSLYVLLAALLLRSLLLREHRRAAVLLALAWAAHPSAALLVPAVLLHLWTCRREVGALGARTLARTAGLAALCAFGPTLLLPVLSAREPAFAMGHVDSPGRLVEHALGRKYLEFPDAWGWSAPRVLSVLRYAWEEFLGVGLAAVVLGVASIRKEAPWRLPTLAAWSGTVLVVTTLFKIEGQHDLWLLAAWLPPHVAAAAGLAALSRRWRHAPFALAAVGLAWAVAANARDLDQRGYDLVERFGEAQLRDLAPDAILILRSDDAVGICTYLQSVRGLRPDVLLVSANFIWSPEGRGWYLERLRKRRPGLRAPDERPPEPSAVASFADVDQPLLAQAALANANAGPGSPVYFETPPPAAAVRRDSRVTRAGLVWRMLPRDEPEPADGALPISAEELAGRMRRPRGQRMRLEGGSLHVEPEPYEWRFLRLLLELRAREAERQVRLGTAEGFRRAVEIYDSLLRLDRDEVFDGRSAFAYGTALVALRDRRAALAFEAALEKGGLDPNQEAAAWLHRGDLFRAEGREDAARDCYGRAGRVAGIDPALKARAEGRQGGK
jgi:tetratricopeptide (TPR) repeat protein